jgi:phosphate/sulfate permease
MQSNENNAKRKRLFTIIMACIIIVLVIYLSWVLLAGIIELELTTVDSIIFSILGVVAIAGVGLLLWSVINWLLTRPRQASERK